MGNKTTICAVKDVSIDTFGQPIFVRRPGQAVRGFTDEVNRQAPDNQMYTHPADFEMWQIGTFDDETATITQDQDSIQRLCRGVDVQIKAE